MNITVEIGYYPLLDNYQKPVDDFVKELASHQHVVLQTGTMSSLLSGEYNDIMNLLHHKLKPFMEKYPSVFTLKISNSCNTCKTD